MAPLERTLVVITTTAFALASLSCSDLRRPAEQPSTTSAMGYEPAGSVARAPLAPPMGYSSPSNESTEAPMTGLGEWRASPRWAAVGGDGCIEVEPAEDEAGSFRVENCSEDSAVSPPRDDEFALPPE